MGAEEKLIAWIMGATVVGVLALAVGLGVINWVSGWTKITTADNVIHNYEWFYDAKGVVDARVAQISSEKKIISEEKDEAELRRLRVDIGGMQQSCRDLVADYNSNSSKVNREIFKSNSLPDRLDAEVCE